MMLEKWRVTMSMLKIAVSLIISILLIPHLSSAKERAAEVSMQFNLNAPAEAKNVRLWIPYPVSDEHQSIEDIRVNGNFSQSGVYREGENGSMALYAEWEGAMREMTLTYTFKVKRKEVIKKDFPKKELPFFKEEFGQYLKATSLGPTTGKVKELAEKITKGKKTNLAKARAIYEKT